MKEHLTRIFLANIDLINYLSPDTESDSEISIANNIELTITTKTISPEEKVNHKTNEVKSNYDMKENVHFVYNNQERETVKYSNSEVLGMLDLDHMYRIGHGFLIVSETIKVT